MIVSKIDPSSSKVDQLLYETCMPFFRKGYIQIGPNKVCLPSSYEPVLDKIKAFRVKDDDIFVVTHPKTGTTWTQEMVWLINNDLNFSGAQSIINERFPFLEVSALFDFSDSVEKIPKHLIDSVQFVEETASPRFIKSHLPWELLPTELTGSTKNKIVYVARNPKDTCVSYFHHYKLLEGFTGTFDDFCELFLANRINYGPFCKHLLEFWNRRDQGNILYLFYEDMKKDLKQVIEKTCKFFGKNFNETQLNQLEEHLRFDSMKDNPAVNYEKIIEMNHNLKLINHEGKFMRSGIVGSYKLEMDANVISKFDRWTLGNFKGTDFHFYDSTA